MQNRIVNFQTDLLRTFVTVVDLGSFTLAGNALGRTQPAISLQIRRLEDLTESPLFVQKGKKLELTPSGHSLLSYAREILLLNDTAAAHLIKSRMADTLRIGLPIDYSVNFFQSVISEFIANHKEVDVQVTCEWSNSLMKKLGSDELDFAIAMTETVPTPYMSSYWAERPVWASAQEFQIDPDRPVPLVVHPAGCAYRARMIQTLEASKRRWRVAFESPGINALQNAVLSGMGVSALTRKTLLRGMRQLSQHEGFAPLEEIKVGLFYKHTKLNDSALSLIEHLTTGLKSFKTIQLDA